MDSLIAAAGHDRSGAIVLDQRYLGEEFQRAYSGAYWQIRPIGAGDTLISHSLLDRTIAFTDAASPRPGLFWGHAEGPDAQHLRVFARHIEFPITATAKPDDSRAYMFFVAADMSGLDERIAQFNGTIVWSFAILGLGLIAAVFIQVRVGLQPLRRVTQSLHRIRDGSARRLEGRFPAEIEPLAAELNSLIEHSAEVVGRARSYVSNLAHFLKTPLSVLSSEAEAQPGPLADAVNRQVIVMRRQVDHYLARAPRRRCAGCPGQPDAGRLRARRPRPHAPPHPPGQGACGRGPLSAGLGLPRRAAGPGRDGRQSDGQCLQMGARPDSGHGAARRRYFSAGGGGRRDRLDRGGARTGRAARREAGRKRTGHGAWIGHRAGYLQALWRDAGAEPLGTWRLGRPAHLACNRLTTETSR
ncbi:MAG: hypothetical protein WDM81_10835 [Rhizomicrobium sp.]